MTPEKEKEWVKKCHEKLKQDLQAENELNKIVNDIKFIAERHIRIDVSLPKNVSVFRTNIEAQQILELCKIGDVEELIEALENLRSTSAYIYANNLKNLI